MVGTSGRALRRLRDVTALLLPGQHLSRKSWLNSWTAQCCVVKIR